MMKNIISSPYRKMKILFILPVFAIVFYSFAKPDYQYISQVDNKGTQNLSSQDSDKKVKGNIIRNDGKPLQGAHIIVTGTTVGTTSDADGYFSIENVPADASLAVSYVGYKSKIAKPVFTSEMAIKMIQDTIKYLNDDIGTPPLPPTILQPPPPPPLPPPEGIILGIKSESHPLVFINGIESPYSRMERLDPNTIESITVLKDRDATDRYGEKGKNGVTIISLKKGTVDLYTPIQNKTSEKVVLEGSAPAGSKIKIRASDGSMVNDLIVIDGVISDIKRLEEIDQNDIASLEVFKDKSATEKYGEKGKDGVIEITLKGKGSATDQKTGEKLFVAVEQLPEFPGGGRDAMRRWISQNLKYPGEAYSKKVTGTVDVGFLVTRKGKIKHVQVIKPVYPSLDAEAKRVIGRMPEWKPGTQHGKAVDVQMKVPVEFKLQ